MNAGHAQVSQNTVFDEFGIKPVVNCCGIYTDLGGSVLSPSIMRAIEELNDYYVDITELLDASGHMIAGLVGADAARVTPGCSAALVLSAAAAMAGNSGKNWEQLPDTTGMKNELLLPRAFFKGYKYLQPSRLSGCSVVLGGPENHFDLEGVMESVNSQTAAILIPAHMLDGFTGADKLKEVCDAAHAVDVPVIVDAAFLSYPISLLRSFAAAGADLTCMSAKYFFGPNSGGFVFGKKQLVSAVEGLDFTRYESGLYKTVGRTFKMSRYDVAATAMALREWVDLDHVKRWATYKHRVDVMQEATVGAVDSLTATPMHFTLDEDLVYGSVVNALELRFEKGRKAAQALLKRLVQNNPKILAVLENDSLLLAIDAAQDGDEDYVASCLRSALASSLT